LEGLNPVGSIKLKAARSMVAAAEQLPGGIVERHLVESTSGNLGIALASICAARKYSLTCVTDPNANRSTIAEMRALGANVVVVEERDENGGFLTSRIRYIERLIERDSAYLWLNQYANPANPTSHEASTAPAILRQFPGLDTLVIGVGTGGTLMGCLRWMRRHSPATKIVAVDAAGSVTFGGAPSARRIPGLGASRLSRLVDPAAPDVIVHVPEADAVHECRRLARTTGLLAGGSTGTVLAAVRFLADSLNPEGTVVALSPDMGERYLNTVYDDLWVRRHGLSAPTQAATASHRKEHAGVSLI
jgi:2,3-diaminopropionate biosynthesis protein SbnA